MRTPLIAIAGWAYPAESLQPLAALLHDLCDTRTCSAADFDPQSTIPPSAHLLGWSLGGMLALEAAAAQPAAVNGLILLSSTACFTRSRDWPHGLPASEVRALGRALRHDAASALQAFFALCSPSQPPLSITAPPMPALKAGLDYLARTDHRPLLARVTCPVLVVHGRDDAVIPVSAGEALAAALPRAQLVICEGSGHDLVLREPERVATHLRSFLHARLPTS